MPHVTLPKPDQSAVFKVMVEGEITDSLESHISGHVGTCQVIGDGHVDDTTTYRRGKGVALQFDRYGKKVMIHRVGRTTDASLAVQVRMTRTATGGTTYSPTGSAPCEIAPYHLADNPDCGKVMRSSGNMLLSYKGGRIGLTVSPSTQGGGGFGQDECGEDPSTGVHDLFALSWPTPPELEPSRRHLSIGAIFGRGHAFRFLLRNSDVGQAAKRKSDYTPPGSDLNTKIEESSRNVATVRLIRKNR